MFKFSCCCPCGSAALIVRVLAVVALGVSGARAVVIDDYSEGSLFDTGFLIEVLQTQSGLDSDAVIGGGRRINAIYGGAFAVGGIAEQLLLNHDRAFLEVAQVQYGSFSAGLSPLDADLTDSGAADRLLIRVDQTTPDEADALNSASVVLTSGVDEGSIGSGGASFFFPASDTPYVISLPFDTISGTLDLTDVDGVSLGFFLNNRRGLIVLDSIESGTLFVGDLDGDGAVRSSDYDAFERFFGVEAPLAADANGNGVVDAADYTLWRDNLPRRATAVPEATGAVLLLAGWLAPLCCWHRRG